MSKLTASQVAKYFINMNDEEAGDMISNLKLQKLIYYAQGFHIAIFNKPLFDDPIVAWKYGPVVENLYREYSRYGSGPIPYQSLDEGLIFDGETKEFLGEIYESLGQFSAWKLAVMTHGEPPWKNARQSCAISHEAMKEYFKTQLTDEET